MRERHIQPSFRNLYARQYCEINVGNVKLYCFLSILFTRASPHLPPTLLHLTPLLPPLPIPPYHCFAFAVPDGMTFLTQLPAIRQWDSSQARRSEMRSRAAEAAFPLAGPKTWLCCRDLQSTVYYHPEIYQHNWHHLYDLETACQTRNSSDHEWTNNEQMKNI